MIATNFNMTHLCTNSAAYDYSLIKQFITLFPTSPMALFLGGYFSYRGVPMFDEKEKLLSVPRDDAFDTMIVSMIFGKFRLMCLTYHFQNAFSATPDSLIATRILTDVYLNELDYPNAVKVAESSLELLHRAETSTGRKLPRLAFSNTWIVSEFTNIHVGLG